MGVICEINVFHQQSDCEFKPGDIVTGIIRYSVNKDITYRSIQVFLKGIGKTAITAKSEKGNPKYSSAEEYVNLKKTVQNNVRLTAGTHETEFEFQLPAKVPSSFEYRNDDNNYKIKCSITYTVEIKFVRPQVYKTDQVFRKEIAVSAYLDPSLPKEPVEFNDEYKLVTILDRRNKIKLKVNVENQVIETNGLMNFNYVIENESKVNIGSVRISLLEKYTFKATGLQKVVRCKEIHGTVKYSDLINSGDIYTDAVGIRVPSNRKTLQHSRLVSRDYFVKLKMILPPSRVDRVFQFPFQVGEEKRSDDFGNQLEFEEPISNEYGSRSTLETNRVISWKDYDPPPSYWEVMGERPKPTDEESEGHTSDTVRWHI